jgi:hypothetical protein
VVRSITLRPRQFAQLDPGQKDRRRARAGLAAVVAGCVALMSVVVLTGAGSATTGVKFTQSGHWVYNSTVGRIFHLDGASRDVDAEVPLKDGQPGSQVVQTDQHGYVLSRSRIDQFGKSDLTVTDPIEPPAANEQPIGLNAAGAAFAVYKNAGRVVRFGDKQTVAIPGGLLGDPVVTSDGTLWVNRVDEGELCQLALSADRMSCPASAPKGHKGALTAVGAHAVFVDLTARQVYTLSGDGIDDRTDLGVADVPDTALVAGNDVDGRLAIVDPGKSVVHLVDVTHHGQPVRKPIPKGNYDKVASSGEGIVLLDRKNAGLVTLDRDGENVQTEHIPAAAGPNKHEPNLYRGDDSRVYVESGDGDRVFVVDRDGDAQLVEVGAGKPGTVKPSSTPTDKPTPDHPTTTPPIKPPSQPPATHETQQPPVRKTPPPNQPGKGRSTAPEHKPDPGKTTNPPPRKTTPPKTTTTPPPAKSTNQPTAKPGRPGAPLGVKARFVDTDAVVTWQAAAAHGATITSYKLSWTGGSTTVGGTARSATIPGLRAKTAYTFTISGVNSAGTGPAVKSNQINLKWNPAESPRELLVKRDGTSGSITLGWMAPTMGSGTFLRYEVSMGARTAPATKTSTTTEATISGLTDKTRYTYFVRAITRASDGQEVVGKYATLTAASVGKGQPTKRVVASRGDGTTYGSDCDHPECAFVQIRIENLKPSTTYDFKPYTSGWGNFNPGYSTKTNAQGQLLVDDQFPCSAVGQLVWATVTGPEGTYTSNKFFWTSDS